MRRGGVEIEVVLLHILPMVALAVGQSEKPLLENGVFAIPQGEGEAQALFVIGDAGNTILTPAIGTGTGMIVGEEIPGITAFTVVLTYGSPLAFA